MIRIGRYTAALAMTATGVILLLDHTGSAEAMTLLRAWWPLVLVALGVELLIVQGFFRKEGTRVRVAFGSMFGAAVLCGFMLVATQGSELRLSWLQQWTDGVSLGLYDSGQAKYSFDKETTVVPVSGADAAVSVYDTNGQVIVRNGPVRDIEVQATVHVDVTDRANAEQIAGKSYVEVKNGERTEIIAHGEPYGIGKLRKPRVDITIILPQGKEPSSLIVHVVNGAISVQPLPQSRELVLDIKNGDISGDSIGGTVRAKVINGDVRLSALNGDAAVETVNGDINLQDVAQTISAKTVNGDIQVKSASVGGGWTLSSTVGDISLAWPDTAGVQVKASTGYGEIDSDWTLQRGKRRAEGTLGEGTWPITADTQADVTLTRLAR